MTGPDLNLIRALDALLAAGSVTEAAARLGLSVSAMSRCLGRLRTITGDPLLVRAGAHLVPTPRAKALATRVPGILADIESVLVRDEDTFDPATLDRTFQLRANEGFIHRFAAPLIAALQSSAPMVRLHLAPKPIKDANALRDGLADLEIGVLGDFAPEVRTRKVFEDDFIAAVRPGHPLLASPVTPERYATALHVVSSRRGLAVGPVDAALTALGLARQVVAVVPGFPDAMEVASRSDLVAQVPRSVLRRDLVGLSLPVSVPGIAVSAMWHPRFEADPEQRWFRETVITTILRIQTDGD
ncbi:LysR family transcriptional regulator [Rhodobacteraceae bacterium]|nr:LysR family transcriptional regulator [Paracoccaceae bacterium]